MNDSRCTPHISQLNENKTFVFGSNLQGIRSGSAVRTTYNDFGTLCGEGIGLFGQSYAIPKMQGPLGTIKPYVDDFIKFVQKHLELTFKLTRIDCEVAGLSDKETAPHFDNAIELRNIYLPKSFWDIPLK